MAIDIEDVGAGKISLEDLLKRSNAKPPPTPGADPVECDGIKGLRGAIVKIREGGGIKFKKNERITHLVFTILTEAGFHFFQSTDGLLMLDNEQHKNYDLASEALALRLSWLTGLSTTEEELRYIVAQAKAAASMEPRRKVRKLADDSKGLIINLGTVDCWRHVGGGEFEHRYNGDGALFKTNDDTKPITPEFGTTGNLDYFFDGFLMSDHGSLTREDQLALLRVFLYQLFFPSQLLSRIIPVAVGPTGGGKSSAAERLGRLIEGPDFDVSDIRKEKEDAVTTDLSSSIFVALDNADSLIPWLEDYLARYATGFKRKERKLYTNNDLISYKADGILMLTTRSCHFKREDVVKRLLLLYFDKEPNYVSAAKIYKELDRRRPAILGELLTQLGMIADYIAEHGDEETESLKFRMSDFADFGMLVARAPGGMGADAWKTLIEKLGDSQTDFSTEDDALLILLGQLLPFLINEGPVRSSELYSLLVKRAEDQRMTIPAKSPSTFGTLLTNTKKLIEARLDVEIIDERRHAGERWLTFRLKANPGGGGGDGPEDVKTGPADKTRTLLGGGGDTSILFPRNINIDVTQQSPTESHEGSDVTADTPASPSPVTSNIPVPGGVSGPLTTTTTTTLSYFEERMVSEAVASVVPGGGLRTPPLSGLVTDFADYKGHMIAGSLIALPESGLESPLTPADSLRRVSAKTLKVPKY
jgi:hypothetical protein